MGDSSRLSGGNTINTGLTLTGLILGEMYYIFVVAFGEEGAPVLPSNHSNKVTVLLCELIMNIHRVCNNYVAKYKIFFYN